MQIADDWGVYLIVENFTLRGTGIPLFFVENFTFRGTGTTPVFRKHASISSSEHPVSLKVFLESVASHLIARVFWLSTQNHLFNKFKLWAAPMYSNEAVKHIREWCIQWCSEDPIDILENIHSTPLHWYFKWKFKDFFVLQRNCGAENIKTVLNGKKNEERVGRDLHLGRWLTYFWICLKIGC